MWLRFAITLLACCWLLPPGSTGNGPLYNAPDDCDWYQMVEEDGLAISLTCHLSAINSNLERTNFSVIPSFGTRSLTVRCNESNSISSLEPAAFANLKELQELNIEGCLIERIPNRAFDGLDKLKKLTIKTSAKSSVLIVDQGSLQGLPSLRTLDLSGNGIRSLPQSELCNLPELLSLDLSYNEIGSLREVLSERQQKEEECLSSLELLNLANNEITTLEDSDIFWPLYRLKELKLSANFIRHVQGSSVAIKSESLQVLDLSQNQITSLPETVFSNFSRTLTLLSIANNSISSLPDKIFDSMSSLEILDLSGNLLQDSHLSTALFRNLSSLLELNLSSNRLLDVKESKELFASLSSLEALKLGHNQLENFPSFPPLPQLRVLELSGNKIDRLDSFSLSGIRQITHLHLNNNQLSFVAEEALQNCSNVLVMDLSHNDLREAPSSLEFLTVLQTLDLSYNQINNIDNAPILKMNHLWRLQLSDNMLQNISVGLFKNLKSLQIVDLSNNAIDEVERGAFDSNEKLQAIRLDGNNLKTMDGLFQNLAHLTWLNISSNHISEFDYALVPRSLHWLDLSNNRIKELGNYFDLTGEVALGVLDVSFNSIRQLGPSSIPDSIQTLLLNDNQLEQIVPYTFFKKNQLTKVDLTVNNLRHIDRNALRLSSEIIDLPDFHLGGNPIECDCQMVWFKNINSASSSSHLNYPIIQDIESIYCRLVYTREVSYVPLVEARNEQFLCPYETHCFALCKCCDFDACDCEMTCPDGCTCYHDNSWSKNIAVCSNEGFRDLPDQLPMDATEIFLDGNNLSELDSHTFIGRKNLRILHLNNSQIHSIRNKTFNGLKSLTVLHLEGNKIEQLKGFEFETLIGLRELYLQNNLISFIHNATFKFLRSLEVLHLHGNHIVDYPVWQLAFNPFLVSVKLADNLWSCNCEFMERFRSWMSLHTSKVFDSESISCVTNEAGQHNVRMANFDVSSCSNAQAIATTRVQEISNENYLPLLAATLASFAVVLLILLAVFIYRHTLRVWIHSKYGVRVFDNSFNEDDLAESGSLDSQSREGGAFNNKLFDIFVSYSPKDELFVRDVLSSELEGQGSSSSQYKTCLYHRDVASQTYVADTIMQATEASRRTLVVLSENFLKSEWSRYDYKSGLHQALRSGKRKIIFVMLGNISSRDIDPDLRLYLKTGVVLNWGDRLFWEKLRYVLPDVPLSKLSIEKPQNNIIYQRTDLASPIKPASIVSSISSSAEEHYYQQPRYASSHLQTLPPLMPAAGSVKNNNLILAASNNNNNHRMLPAPPPNMTLYHPGILNPNFVTPHLQQQQEADGSAVVMPSLPGRQEMPGRTVIMHI